MTKRDQVELIRLLEAFYNELNCNFDCGKCEYSIRRGRDYTCPILCCKTAVEDKYEMRVKT